MAKTDAKFIAELANYPPNGSFRELLTWHLSWGTRPYCDRLDRTSNDRWVRSKFAEFVHEEGFPLESAKKNLRNWANEGRLPDNQEDHDAERISRIFREFFGNDPDLRHWAADLQNALDRGRHEVEARVAGSNVASTVINRDNEHIGADAREGVAVVAEKLAKHFYGRASDLAAISAFVDERMASGEKALLLITAPAGFGKSALAVTWCNKAIGLAGRHVASHLCSISSGEATTSLDNIYANLRRQLANIYGDATDKFKDKDAIVNLLATTPPDGKQVVVWLDGIDEAREPLPCFLPSTLGERVCVIVSARADDDSTPTYIDEWQYSERASQHSGSRWNLTKLSQDDVDDMASGMFAAADLTAPDDLAQRIFAASDQGYALFARYMVEDAIDAAKSGKNPDFGDAPESLENYAKLQLKRLERLSTWPDYQPAFAFLTIAREAVRIDDLPTLIGQPVFVESAPPQIFRWLSVVHTDDGNSAPLLGFAHPKLAEMFGRALSYQRRAALNNLCALHENAERFHWSQYAWRHMPSHLIEASRYDVAERHLLSLEFIDQRFSALGAEEGPRLMSLDWMHWHHGTGERSHPLQKRQSAKNHLRFWNNYADPLSEAAGLGFGKAWLQIMHDVELADIIQDTSIVCPKRQFLATSIARISGGSARISDVIALKGCGGFLSCHTDGTLRLWGDDYAQKAVFIGHNDGRVSSEHYNIGYWCNGAIELDDGEGFLSWGDDSTLRLWGSMGQAVHIMRGHTKSVRGALVLAGRAGYISWSDDETLRLWNRSGREIAVLEGHTEPVCGAMQLTCDQGFLSWGNDRTLRLWDRSGKHIKLLGEYDRPIRGETFASKNDEFLAFSDNWKLHIWRHDRDDEIVLHVPEHWFTGALFVDDGPYFITWSEQGLVGVWGEGGEQIAAWRIHADAINGVSPIPNMNAFVSWSDDRTLRIWRDTGEELAALKGHWDRVLGALVAPNGTSIVSWSADGSLRLWDIASSEESILCDGEGHVEYGRALYKGESLITWSDDQRAKIWTPFDSVGENVQEPIQHAESAMGFNDGDGFLTWGYDGNLHLWGRSGESCKTLNGRENGITGVLPLRVGNAFLSRSFGGPLQLWSREGDEIALLTGHSESVNGILEFGKTGEVLSWSSDKTLRLWGLDGKERGVMKGHSGDVTGALSLDDNTKLLSWSDDRTLRIWNSTSLQSRCLEGHEHPVLGAFVMDNSKCIVSWDHAEFRLWTAAGEHILAFGSWSLDWPTGVIALPHDDKLLSWGMSGILKLWDAGGHLIEKWQGHRGPVDGAISLPDQSGFLTWGRDRQMRIWNIEGQETATFDGHSDRIVGASVIGVDKVLSWGVDATLRMWNFRGELQNVWLSPSGPINYAEPYGTMDQYLVVFGRNAGIVNLPSSYQPN